MTDLAMSPRVQQLPDVTGEVTEAAQTSTLITEHEVLLGSTAALTGSVARRRGFFAAMRALFVSTEKAKRTEKRSKPKHYPKRYSYIENAAMAREMHRL